jgi:hypothetical protein
MWLISNSFTLVTINARMVKNRSIQHYQMEPIAWIGRGSVTITTNAEAAAFSHKLALKLRDLLPILP